MSKFLRVLKKLIFFLQLIMGQALCKACAGQASLAHSNTRLCRARTLLSSLLIPSAQQIDLLISSNLVSLCPFRFINFFSIKKITETRQVSTNLIKNLWHKIILWTIYLICYNLFHSSNLDMRILILNCTVHVNIEVLISF